MSAGFIDGRLRIIFYLLKELHVMKTKDQLDFVKPIGRFAFRSALDNEKEGLVAVIYYQRNRVTDEWEPGLTYPFPEEYSDDERVAIWEKCIAAIQAEIKQIERGDYD